jgi:hypothetical protein
MPKSRLILLWLALILPVGLVPGFGSGAAQAAQLTPHRAIYSIKLTKPQSGSSIISGNGLMTIQYEKSCDGWITGQTWRMDMNTLDGKTLNSDIRYATWESFDGLSLRFSMLDKSDGKKESIKGQAKVKSVPGTGSVTYQEPKKKILNLSEDAIFPIKHLLKIIEQAEQGKQLVPYVLFDGASKKGPLRVVTFIGKKHAAGSVKMPIESDLLNQPGWTMRMAFYPVDSLAAEPEYELEVMQLANGVVPFVAQDYPEFSIEMTLEKLEAVKPVRCS